MRKTACLIVLALCISILAGNTWHDRMSNSARCIAEQGSYTVVINFDVTSVSWTAPDSIIILAVCIEDSGSIMVRCPDKDSVVLYSPDFQCYPVRITGLYRVGTDDSLRTKVTGFGYKMNK